MHVRQLEADMLDPVAREPRLKLIDPIVGALCSLGHGRLLSETPLSPSRAGRPNTRSQAR